MQNTPSETNPQIPNQPAPRTPSAWRRRTPVLSFVISVLLIGGLATAMTLASQKQDIRQQATYTGPTLSMNPSTATKNVDETFPVGLVLQTGDETVSAAEIHVSFNPQVLEAVSVQAGSYLPVVLVQGSITNGQANITLGSEPTDPKQGTGIMATITFRAKSAGTSALAYTNATKVASIGKTTNTLSGSTGATITTSASTVPTATPVPGTTLTPTPSPTPAPDPATDNPADISGEGIVNFYDYALYISAWFLNNLDVADLNNDGKKSVVDFTIFMNGWYDYLQHSLE